MLKTTHLKTIPTRSPLFKESIFITHAPCPRCNSKDNLGIYNDHEYCFGCGHVKFYDEVKMVEKKEVKIALPSDTNKYIPHKPLLWLQKYGIKSKHINENKIQYSDSRELLLFPFYGEDGTLLAWQGRYFGTDPKQPKWFSRGPLNDTITSFNLTYASEHGIILVEDIVSAIKVGEVFSSCCLFGSVVSKKLIARLNLLGINTFYIWLDRDKTKNAFKFAGMLNSLGYKARTIVTELDPKEYDLTEIENIVEAKLFINEL